MTKPVALIVGGGSGIGADIARVLAEDGFDVGVMSSSSRGEALGAELSGLGFTGSNLIPKDLEKFRGAALDRFGRIDALVNNTGHGPKGDVRELSDADRRLSMNDCLLHAAKSVQISDVPPGFIDGLPIKPERVARIPAGRNAQVRDLSRVVAFLASDAASYTTDQNIRVDVGLTRSI